MKTKYLLCFLVASFCILGCRTAAIRNVSPLEENFRLQTGWYYVADTANGYARQLDKSYEIHYLDPRPIVVAKNIKSFEIYEARQDGETYLSLLMWLDIEGTESWSRATRNAQLSGTRLAFVVDNRLLQISKVNSEVTNGATTLNRGGYSEGELEGIKKSITTPENQHQD